MSSPSPLLVVPTVLWTAVAAVAVVTAIVRSVRIRRRSADPAGSSAPWNPYGPDFTVAVVAAAAGYAVGALIARRFTVGQAALGILWPTLAATALAQAARGRLRGSAPVVTVLFAAVGAALLGVLPG
ncbi:hypothetical protein [Streptomyces sp. NRRL S-37]|uniref:hypothetical protein n=1 Tax=Streptomyces sp. NRRL S-37 TaxID=1463903 RepID=UPI0004C75BCA|nr:hypothetical protein [Streptomyces sp. NRRL S-37]